MGSNGATYISSIGCVATLIVVPNFVEIILVKLSDKAREVAVFKMLRQYGLGKFFVLQRKSCQNLGLLRLPECFTYLQNYEAVAIGAPSHN